MIARMIRYPFLIGFAAPVSLLLAGLAVLDGAEDGVVVWRESAPVTLFSQGEAALDLVVFAVGALTTL